MRGALTCWAHADLDCNGGQNHPIYCRGTYIVPILIIEGPVVSDFFLFKDKIERAVKLKDLK